MIPTVGERIFYLEHVCGVSMVALPGLLGRDLGSWKLDEVRIGIYIQYTYMMYIYYIRL